MIWLKTALSAMLLASVERKRGALGAGKLKVVSEARHCLDLMNASSCCASHKRDFGLPDRAKYRGAMMWVRPSRKR